MAYSDSGENSSFLVSVTADDESALPLAYHHAPLASSYNNKIRPLLDAIDKLRNLQVMQVGIQLPTIVVVGDQSSGKSSVLESLAGISLPRGVGICTRVPLIMRLLHHPNPQPELRLEYLGKMVPTDETHIAEAINVATNEIAGHGKGISHTPLTLSVKKNGVPDLTMVDLPGITRVPVHGQPEDIYEQISNIIMEYIKPEESIILNVLSATVDFPTCESIRMSRRVDKTGERTLAVVTKSDKAPEGLREKVMADEVGIGLGYVCVRNRIGEESYEAARMEEMRLFESDPLLSKIDKSMVGVPVLAQKLVQIQATIISKCLPEIVKKINGKLDANFSELHKMPRKLNSVPEAIIAFMRIVGLSKGSLMKILVRSEFDEYPDDRKMHCTARLAEMLRKFSERLKTGSPNNVSAYFLENEIEVIRETKGIELPKFLSRSAFHTLMQIKIKEISEIPGRFVSEVWAYVETIVVDVLTHHSENYPQLELSITRAAQNLVSKMRERFTDRVMEIVEMEKLADYTCDPQYMTEWSKLMKSQGAFLKILSDTRPGKYNIEGFGEIEVRPLRDDPAGIIEDAFDMKMRIHAYWKIVLKRMIDCIALQLLLTIHRMVNGELEYEVTNEVMGPRGDGVVRLLEESPSVATKRASLNKNIRLLKESRNVLANIKDRIL